MPEALRSGPYRFFFWSRENNEPPHVHVRREKMEAKFWLEPVEVAQNWASRDTSSSIWPRGLSKIRLRFWRSGVSTLAKPETAPEPIAVTVTADTLSVDLADGRTISVPLGWFPRLRHGSPRERSNFEMGRNGVHWPDLDEDIPVAGLLNGEKSGESLASIQRWLRSRSYQPKRAKKVGK